MIRLHNGANKEEQDKNPSLRLRPALARHSQVGGDRSDKTTMITIIPIASAIKSIVIETILSNRPPVKV